MSKFAKHHNLLVLSFFAVSPSSVVNYQLLVISERKAGVMIIPLTVELQIAHPGVKHISEYEPSVY